MAIVIFYHSTEHSHKDHQSVIDNKGVPAGFVRAEYFGDEDLEDALEKAKPHEGETVLNSVELP